MGLFDILMKIKPKKKERKILILGLENAGKTSILKHLSGDDISNVTPTQGFNIKSLSALGVKFKAWDIGGQPQLRSYWRQYYSETDVLVFVIDAADKKSLDDARAEFEHLLEEDKLAGVPTLVLANKQDVSEAISPEAIAESLNLSAIRDRQWHIQACSAANGTGINSGMQWIVQNAKK